MTTVCVRLACMLPRWALSIDPHVVVDGRPPVRLGKSPVCVDVDCGSSTIVVLPSRERRNESWPHAFSPAVELGLDLAPDEVVAVRYRPSPIQAWLFQGRLRREGHVHQ